MKTRYLRSHNKTQATGDSQLTRGHFDFWLYTDLTLGQITILQHFFYQGGATILNQAHSIPTYAGNTLTAWTELGTYTHCMNLGFPSWESGVIKTMKKKGIQIQNKCNSAGNIRSLMGQERRLGITLITGSCTH